MARVAATQRFKLSRLFVTIAALLGLGVEVHAQDRWTLLASPRLLPGEVTASVDTTSSIAAIKALRLVVREAITIGKVEIVYRDGRRHEEARLINMSANERTRSIDPQEADRLVDHISLHLDRPAATSISVEIWGLESEESVAARAFNQLRARIALDETRRGGEVLALTRIALTTPGEVELRDGPVQGPLDGLAFTTRHANLRLVSVSIGREDGSRSEHEINQLLTPGTRTTIPLASGARIKSVRAKYAPADAGGASTILVMERHVGRSRPKMALASKDDETGVAKKWFNTTLDTAKKAEGDGISGDCVSDNKCTPVRIFFGTNRQRSDAGKRISFGPEREGRVSLGSAIVTVPKKNHSFGEIERPSWWSFSDWYRYVTRAGPDPTRQFVLPADGTQLYASADEFIAAVKAAGKDAGQLADHGFIYIHGFNTGFDDALKRVAQMSYDLGEDDAKGNRIPFGRSFLFSWPARAGSFGIADYKIDSSSAEVSQKYIREFLELVVTRADIKHVHLIAHSMGNAPLLNVLEALATVAKPGLTFNQVILAAPDVDRDRFVQVAEIIAQEKARASAEKRRPLVSDLTLYASKNDKALKFSTDVIHKGVPRAGYVPPIGPVVAAGVETIDVSELSLDVIGINHDAYASETELIGDISRMIRDFVHPPHKRNNIIRRQPLEPATVQGVAEYWYYPRSHH